MSLRTRLAALSHDIWSHWMRYMFSKGEFTDSGWLMPAWAVERWRRQMETPYEKLSEQEQKSDIEQADKILVVIGTSTNLEFDRQTALEWYDGPLIVRAESQGKTYLGLLVPDDRWMYARLNEEQIALLDKHELPLRETFKNATDGYVYIQTMLEVSAAALTEDYLPTEDAGTI